MWGYMKKGSIELPAANAERKSPAGASVRHVGDRLNSQHVREPEIRFPIMVNETEDAVAAKWQLKPKRFSCANSTIEQRPRDRHKSNLTSLGGGDAPHQIAKPPRRGMGQCNRYAARMIEGA